MSNKNIIPVVKAEEEEAEEEMVDAQTQLRVNIFYRSIKLSKTKVFYVIHIIFVRSTFITSI